ncbi:hypothetical protein K470DRAFT_254688 [Piedraia hortae CBS 480.64]|uniref:DNA repair and recombination protein RAD26 n=1 Tax=Piedraia hortae CBS 480.64 TaxID=1314780 RepID=A0A6A7C899_9PEZI|nr:hypothetical protein K470DRAFT_254688 [Piedraia hortae CBS 480.64]
MDEATALAHLSASTREQDDLERAISQQASSLLLQQADERDRKRLAKSLNKRTALREQISRLKNRLPTLKTEEELITARERLEEVERDITQIRKRIGEREVRNDGEGEGDKGKRLVGESRREYLIRTGKITPFAKVGGSVSADLGEVLRDAEEGEDDVEGETGEGEVVSHQFLHAPGFEGEGVNTENDEEIARRLQQQEEEEEVRPKRRRLVKGYAAGDYGGDATRASSLPVEGPVDDVVDMKTTLGTKRKRKTVEEGEVEDLAGIDDGNENVYKRRLEDWVRRRRAARGDDGDDSVEEWQMPHPTRADTVLVGGLRIPGDIYPSLFDYQKTGVQWLWELYSQQVGGIIGDEMGLGKTIQAISFIAALHYSGKLTQPVIIVCPATVMKQWVNEFHRWWPPLRVSILHTSGSGMLDIKGESRYEDALEEGNGGQKPVKNARAARRIVNKVLQDGHVLVTTYTGLQTYADQLIPVDWGYAVLDEGHKIRNPNTRITIYCKELRTHNRVILSGTPMQNNLTELWSLFDFVYPMRLGTLVTFREQFEIPIKLGGYANASNLEVETAAKCAETLKDTISPYLLQRFKADVAADLPNKSERVLFCKLTPLQRQAYEWFLKSNDMKSILAGKRHALFGVDILRKICNHPDLLYHKRPTEVSDYGEASKSGKMCVLRALLEIWKRDGHKTLLFAQHRIMLDILEPFLRTLPGINFLRMDGTTSIKDRQGLVDKFNASPEIHIFLLTTKVGGLGINLTGANRVIIYDPDWNPSTDVQARERAWRLGQKREVEIYRLMTAGTIEEKIYHRQIFKQILTNKILRDPGERQTFHLKDLYDLFTLAEEGCESSLFDVAISQHNTLAGVAREETLPTDPAPEEKKASDDRILNSIFARSGVQSAVEHDSLVSGKTRIRADPVIIEQHAKRVAAQAARELAKAGEVAKTVPAGVPTWTGQVGVAGRAGPSSASVFAGLAAAGVGRDATTKDAGANAAAGRDANATAPRGKGFLAMIRDYLKANGGSVYTQMLIDHFSRFCGSQQRTAEFREMLREIATLEKGTRGRGRWVLKGEFR